MDNIIFISILASKLPAAWQQKTRVTGLGMAVFSRILLLFSLSWIIGLSAPLFSPFGFEVSGRDVILILGGLFLLAKPLGEFVGRHPTIKILALGFLLLIGFTLIVEGLYQNIPKGYVYFAMGFSVFVEMLNLWTPCYCSAACNATAAW